MNKFRCGYPGCTKRYASTDGVRKHARKTHAQWLKNVDAETSLRRDQRRYGSKPSTYCILETPEAAPAPSFLAAEVDRPIQDGNAGIPRNPLDSPAAQAVAAFLIHDTARLQPGALLPSLSMLPAFEAAMAGRRVLPQDQNRRLINEQPHPPTAAYQQRLKRPHSEIDSVPLEHLQTPLEIETLFDDEELRAAQQQQQQQQAYNQEVASTHSSSDELSALDTAAAAANGESSCVTPPTAMMPRPDEGGVVSPFELSRAVLACGNLKQLPPTISEKMHLQDDEFVKSFMAKDEEEDLTDKDDDQATLSSSASFSADEEAFFATLFAS